MSAGRIEPSERSWRDLGILQRSAPVTYGAALAFVALSSILQRVIFPPPSVASFLFFSAGVICAAWFGGFGPGMLATALSALLGNLEYSEPLGHLTVSGQLGLATLLVLPIGCLIALIGGSLRKSVVEARAHLAALRASEERLRLAQAASGVGIYDLDVTAGTMEYDARAGDILGLPASPRILPLDVLLRSILPEDRELVVAALERARETGTDWALEYRLLREGPPRWVRATGHLAMTGGSAVRCVGTVEDVTAQKESAESLRAANAKLADTDRRRNEFLGMLSHELRNPLAPIRTSLHLLERTDAGGEQARRLRAVLRRQVDQLVHLIEDLLDVTRITRGKIHIQPRSLDLVEVVRATVEDHRALLETDHRVSVELPARTVPIEGDAVRLSQAIGNLLSNASKFTPAGGSIAVSLRVREGWALVEVADSGIGMDEETLRTIFEPFSQADRSIDRTRGGLGLGLAIVKGIAELHGGEVTAASDGPGRGSRVTITLPLAGEAARASSDAHRPPTAPNGGA